MDLQENEDEFGSAHSSWEVLSGRKCDLQHVNGLIKI